MNNLRDIVRRHVEEATLNDYLGVRFDIESAEEKQRLLGILRQRGEIDRECDEILGAFQRDINRNSTDSKRKRFVKIVFSAINLVCTAVIGYGVNITNWTIVWSVSTVLFLAQIISFIYE